MEFWSVLIYPYIYSDLLQITILATIFCTLAGGGLGNLHTGGLGLVQYHFCQYQYFWHQYFTICNLHTGGPPALVGGLGNPQNIELDTLLHCIGCDPSYLSLPKNHFFTAENTSIFGKNNAYDLAKIIYILTKILLQLKHPNCCGQTICIFMCSDRFV